MSAWYKKHPYFYPEGTSEFETRQVGVMLAFISGHPIIAEFVRTDDKNRRKIIVGIIMHGKPTIDITTKPEEEARRLLEGIETMPPSTVDQYLKDAQERYASAAADAEEESLGVHIRSMHGSSSKRKRRVTVKRRH